MNKVEFLSALRRKLAGLPPEERQNAMQYYEDYFADAGPEHEAEAIAGLGSPEAVAQAILNDYRDLASHGDGSSGKGNPPRQSRPIRRGISPWLLLAIVLLAIPLGVPVLVTGVSLLGAFFAVLLCVLLAPVILGVVGIGMVWGGIAALFHAPASGLLTIGAGLVLLALAGLLALLLLKLCMLFLPPLARGFVNLCRKPFERRRDRP